MKFTKVSTDAFDELQMNAGVLLSSFDPADPDEPASADIIATTTGGITVSCVPTYSDFGEDVDNVPNNMMEFKHLDGWDCSMAFSSIKFNEDNLKLAIGAVSETTTSGVTKYAPRRDLAQTDFQDLWWVGDKADGGGVAIKLLNGLSTGGFSMQSTKNGKGTMSMTITGHVSIDAQDTMPMEFYIIESDENMYRIAQTLSHVSSTDMTKLIESGNSFSTVLTAAEGYTISNVVVLMGGEDITSSAWTSGTGTVSIASVSGNVEIIATATN